MRVDAFTYPGKRWLIWHVPTCAEWPRVMWVDDETHELGELLRPVRLDPATGEAEVVVRRFRQVLVLPERSLVLLDPVADEAPGDGVQVHESAGAGVSSAPAPGVAAATAAPWKAGAKAGLGAAAGDGRRAFSLQG